MAFRLSATIANRIEGNVKNGRTSEMLAHDIVMRTQIDQVKVKIPGGIAATFKRDDDVGRTFGHIYGEFTAEAILDAHAERIYNGEYVGRLKASEDVKVSFAGQKSLGGEAIEVMLMACIESSDPKCQGWASNVVQSASGTEVDASTEATTPPKKSRKGKGKMAEAVGLTVE